MGFCLQQKDKHNKTSTQKTYSGPLSIISLRNKNKKFEIRDKNKWDKKFGNKMGVARL